MKRIYLFFSRISQYARQSKILFILFVLTAMLNTWVLIYAYGNFLPTMISRNSSETWYREYKVIATQSDHLLKYEDMEEQFQLLDNEETEYCLIKTSEAEETKLCASLENAYAVPLTAGSSEFTDRRQTIAPMGTKVIVGEEILIHNELFTVIGKSAIHDFYVIPINDWIELELGVSSMEIRCKHRQDFENDIYMQELTGLFENYVVKTPAVYVKADESISNQYLFIIGIGYTIEAIAFVSLLHFLLESGRTENIVSLIAGATKQRIFFMIFFETLFITIVPILVAELLYATLYPVAFVKLNFVENIVYDWKDYFLITLITTVPSGLVILLFNRKFVRNNIIKIHREGMEAS